MTHTQADLLDMSQIKLSDIRPKKRTTTERWLKYLGFPLGIAAFLAIYYMSPIEGLTFAGQVCLGAFALALIWWTTEPIPTHVTSLILIATLVLFHGWGEKEALGVLGMNVIWLNIMAFILSSMLVKTNLARRLSLWLMVAFGKSASRMLFAFLLLQLFLAALIPATAARAVMTLPIMMVVAAIYGSTPDKPGNFGRALFLHNLHGINTGSAAYITGSTANLIAAAFILSMAGEEIFYTDWLFANMPIVALALLASWWGSHKLIFRLKPEERAPQLEGGLARLRAERDKLGPLRADEYRTIAIFALVLFLWMTDKLHTQWFGFQISAVMAAALGAIIALLPRVGVINWNEADIPWHLMIFSCGAYAGGLSLRDSGAARVMVGKVFEGLGITAEFGFWRVYVIIILLNMFSHMVFTSKTMRTLIFIPFVITVAQTLGYPPLALALPAAFTIDWVNTVPINAKPNVILFTTGQYSVIDSLKAGLYITVIGSILYIIAGFTWFRWLGIMDGVEGL
ncbi:anion permease [Myxococcota bacterium]|nr:anion permease [Myxococcota bacterium]MBU1433215.1 anion permease [Myxococcota bacterium]MBU1896333.1 anion permease [Myxococcota bacterium]